MTIESHRRKYDTVSVIRGPQATVIVDEATPWIAFRESAARASEHPWLPRCLNCGCESDRLPVHHSPRCSA